MLQYFRDPAWQFVGVILALMAIAATIIIYMLQRQRKRLSYEVTSRNQLLTVREEIENKVQIIYDGQPIRDICLLVIKLINTGNVAISSFDYERSLSISTGTSSKILSAAVTEVDPENLNVNISPQESSISLEPILLNPRDSISLKILVSDFEGKIGVDGRILGVKKIGNIGSLNSQNSKLLALSLAAAATGLYLMIHFTPKPLAEPPAPIEAKIGIALFVVSYFAMLYPIARSGIVRKAVHRFISKLYG